MRISQRIGQEERGQSLVVVILALLVVFGFAAAAIDVANWYQKRHQAQLSADASALAAANCLAKRICTATTPSGDAGLTATSYASTNQVRIPSGDISFDGSNERVTVTTATAAPVSFAGLFSLHPTASATAVASWAGGQVPYSFFSANTQCATGTGSPLGIYVNAAGGGGTTILGMYTDGQYYNSNDSGNAYYDGQVSSSSSCGGGASKKCSSNQVPYTDNCWETKSSWVNSAPPTQYPTCYPEPGTGSTPAAITSNCATPPAGAGPTCLYAPDNYWTTDSSKGGTGNRDLITGPPPAGDAYCVGASGTASTAPATTASGGCSSTADGTAGSIYINTALPSGGYEFAGPCVVFNYPGNAGNVSLSSPSGQPLVYGTANTQSTGVPDTYISTPNSGTTSMGTVFDPLGTVQFAGNNAFVGYVEAMNIQITANNNVTGTGPMASNQPGVDSLVG